MKVNVEIECTPEEARRAMGLPDVTPVHDRYVSILLESLDKGASPEMLEQMMRAWTPMGEAGMGLWRQLFDMAGTSKKS